MRRFSRQMGHNSRIHANNNSRKVIKLNSSEGLVESFYRRPNRVRLQVTIGPSPVEFKIDLTILCHPLCL